MEGTIPSYVPQIDYYPIAKLGYAFIGIKCRNYHFPPINESIIINLFETETLIEESDPNVIIDRFHSLTKHFISKGKLKSVIELIDLAAKHSLNPNFKELFIVATDHGVLDIIKFFIENHIDINDEDYLIRTIVLNQFVIVAMLVEAGADIRFDDDVAVSLATAASISMLRYVMTFDLDVRNRYNLALTQASYKCSFPCVLELLNSGADINCEDGSLINGIFRKFAGEELLKLLPFNPNLSYLNPNILTYLLRKCNIDIITNLTNAGADFSLAVKVNVSDNLRSKIKFLETYGFDAIDAASILME